MSALHALAAELHAPIIDTDDGGRILLPCGGIVYAAFTGKVRIQRYGLPVVTVGAWDDPADALAGAVRAEVARTAAAS